MKRLSFITQLNIEFLVLFNSCRKLLGIMSAFTELCNSEILYFRKFVMIKFTSFLFSPNSSHSAQEHRVQKINLSLCENKCLCIKILKIKKFFFCCQIDIWKNLLSQSPSFAFVELTEINTKYILTQSIYYLPQFYSEETLLI